MAKKSVTQEKFAEAYLDIANRAEEELITLPWWRFKERSRVKKRLKWAKYHYNKLSK